MYMTLKRSSFLFLFLLMPSLIQAMSCPTTSPWSAPIQLSTSNDLTSGAFSAATAAGFMAVWADGANNAVYSFSTDGLTWQSGLISPAQGNVVSGSNVFIAGNATGFLVSWVDSSANGWSTFTADNGSSWSTALQINPMSVPALTPLNATVDVYLSAGSSGFIATMIGNDNNVYASFSTGTSAWSNAPIQATNDGSVNYPFVPRQYVSAVVVDNSCMLTWATTPYSTAAAYIESINPLSSSTTSYFVNGIGYSQSEPIIAALNGYFLITVNANVSGGAVLTSIGTNAANFATPYVFAAGAPPPPLTNNAPWIAVNKAGFVSTWSAGGDAAWAITTNNGFDWTPQCSILSSPSSSIFSPIALSANDQGYFVATWIDSNDNNAYTSFYFNASGNILPPTNLKGSKQVNRFFTQSVYSNTITWSAPLSGNTPVSYSIYRDAALTTLAGTVTSSQPLQFVDQNRQPGKQYSYYIVSVDGQENVSAPATIVVP
jgi:hypothetical protein